jgi:hypothetical protein
MCGRIHLSLPSASGALSDGIPVFSAHRNSVNQTISHATVTKIKWTTEDFDSHGYFERDADDSGGATESRFTPLIAGVYVFVTALLYTSAVDQNRLIAYVTKNGAISKTNSIASSGTITQGVFVVAAFEANGSTDYFEAATFQNTGGDLTLSGSAPNTFFQGWRVA